ncbi:MAG: hypothetical protein LBV47_03790 [Bacteroidales bacterium]|jgi:hypothetical protein|nr:hypothetical protein [Bacteroidales bacterium]
MKLTILILAILTIARSGYGQNNREQYEERSDKYTGVYEYVDPHSSEGDQYIILTEVNGKTAGFYYGTSDEFDEAREGYLPAFFVLPMNQLKINADTIEFVLTVENSDYLTRPVDLGITSTLEAMKSGYVNWGNRLPPASKKYIGVISPNAESISFRGETGSFDRKLVKLKRQQERPYQITNFRPHSNAIPADSILYITETCLITIQPEIRHFEDEDSEEADAWFTAMDDWGYYMAQTSKLFDELGVKNVNAEKRYLSFALAGGERIIVDTREMQNGWPAHMLLYKQGHLPLYINTADPDMEGICGYLGTTATTPGGGKP